MYELVRDVSRYPEFLPWCPSSHVEVPPHEDGGRVLQARIDMAYLGVRSSFTTRNVHQFPESISLELVDGPFRSLQGHWRFRALGDEGCKVTLELEYRFAAGLLARMVAPVFERVAGSLVDAFAARARQLYDAAPVAGATGG